MPRCTPEKYAREARHDRRHVARRCTPQAALAESHDRRCDHRQCAGMVRLCRLRLLRRDDRGGVLSHRQPDRVAVDHVWRVRAGLFCAAIGRDRHRWVYRPRRTQSRPAAVDRVDDDRHDFDGGDAGLRDDWHCGADHPDARAVVAGIFGRRRVRQRRQLPYRARRRAARVRCELAICHWRHDHCSRLAVRRHPETMLTHQQLVDWGWRIPYIFGMLVGAAGLYIRAKIVETPEFVEAELPPTIPISDLLRRHPLPMLLALGISIISNASFSILAYMPTYGQKTLHLPASTGFTATLVGGTILAIGCPLAGYWSDRISRPLLMVIACWLFVLTPYPAFYLMAASPSQATCILAVGWLQLVKAAYSGVLPSLMAEQFPVEVRAIGVALGYSVSVSVFGGLAPLTATWLIAQTGDPLSPSYYLIFTALLSLIALIAIGRRTARRDRTLGLAASGDLAVP